MLSFDRIHYSIRGSYLVWDKKGKETLKMDMGKLRDFFPDSTPKDITELIFKILAEWRDRNMEKAKIRWGREER